MRSKAGPIAIAIGVIVLVVYFVVLYRRTMVVEHPANYVPAQAYAAQPDNRKKIQAIAVEKYGAPNAEGQVVGKVGHGHVHGD